jgi:hypothetical protein
MSDQRRQSLDYVNSIVTALSDQTYTNTHSIVYFFAVYKVLARDSNQVMAMAARRDIGRCRK